MPRLRILLAALTFASLTGARDGGAQSSSDFAAYLGMISTPNGSLPPLATALPQDGYHGPGFNLRYGRIDFGQGSALNAYGAGVTFTGGPRSRVGVTGGLFQGSCGGCRAYPMLGLVYGGAILPEAAESKTATSLGLDLEVGFSNPERVTILSAAASVPLALNSRLSGGSRIALFVAPGLGAAHLSSGSDSDIGARPTIGGGIGVETRNGIGLNVGMRHVIMRNSDPLLGVGFSYGGRPQRRG